MIRTTARKALLLAAVAFSVGLAATCSYKDKAFDSDVGSVGLAITLPSGATLSTIHYILRNGSNTDVGMGDIAVGNLGATASGVIGGVAAGNGYTITLGGTASDGTTCSGTSAPFPVLANSSTGVNVLMLCRGVTGTGTIVVNGQIDNCPAVSSFVVSPVATGVNGHISVNASGTDLDAGDVVTFAWTATAGTFDTPLFPSATFSCPATSSLVTLTVTVSDNFAPGTMTPKCSSSQSFDVNCGFCGNGRIDSASGEQCDPPNGTSCDSSCQTIAVVCGNSILQTGEQCDPPNGITCSSTCQNVPIVCGNRIVQQGEQCDPPNGTTCSATCQTVTATGGVSGTGGAGTGGAGTGGVGTGGRMGTGGANTGGTGTGGRVGTGGANTGGVGTGGRAEGTGSGGRTGTGGASTGGTGAGGRAEGSGTGGVGTGGRAGTGGASTGGTGTGGRAEGTGTGGRTGTGGASTGGAGAGGRAEGSGTGGVGTGGRAEGGGTGGVGMGGRAGGTATGGANTGGAGAGGTPMGGAGAGGRAG